MDLVDIMLCVAKSSEMVEEGKEVGREAQKWAKHIQLGSVWGVGKFQDSSDGCKPVFSIPFNCHFSSLIFALHRQYPVLKKPFHPLQNHPKTPQETPEELFVSETSAVLTFKHMVEIVKKKYGLASRVCSGGLQALC